ncbi:uncharacterized protein VTP21DRAFT_3527 [Calcarisporiella thermophila]|uniref:uncharacterized protein n=1 Tax=Calcarisporiella thermophila TaxID=911321 RepID=UPI003743965C
MRLGASCNVEQTTVEMTARVFGGVHAEDVTTSVNVRMDVLKTSEPIAVKLST